MSAEAEQTEVRVGEIVDGGSPVEAAVQRLIAAAERGGYQRARAEYERFDTVVDDLYDLVDFAGLYMPAWDNPADPNPILAVPAADIEALRSRLERRTEEISHAADYLESLTTEGTKT